MRMMARVFILLLVFANSGAAIAQGGAGGPGEEPEEEYPQCDEGYEWVYMMFYDVTASATGATEEECRRNAALSLVGNQDFLDWIQLCKDAAGNQTHAGGHEWDPSWVVAVDPGTGEVSCTYSATQLCCTPILP